MATTLVLSAHTTTLPLQAHASMETARLIIMAATTCAIYDHLLTLDVEVINVWTNDHQKNRYKLLFALNRYLPEVVMFFVTYSTSASPKNIGNPVSYMASSMIRPINLPFQRSEFYSERYGAFPKRLSYKVQTVHMAVPDFIGGDGGNLAMARSTDFINRRVYSSWGLQKRMTKLLSLGFMVFIVALGALTVIVGLELHSTTEYFPDLHACAFKEQAAKLPYLLGILAAFDLFLIGLAGYSALETPYRTSSEAIDSFLKFGATLLFALFVMRLTSFIMSLVTGPAETLGAACISFVVNSIFLSRILLRLEHAQITEAMLDSPVELEESSYLSI
ncbi:hypothetical protein PM082_000088 [Marasmius tenuissimus]|nr:hypothetical protein PM082_000088 [Marasmius tenuissimus]